eukprot:TRINITY_DN2754_c0_g1_i2.p1 TRINITY_DN2754_c0_g1~~TRINITY_DN2754_c0_g1_i2.p1  ORF type:complete len:242 (-),score=48.51 TRINITY_DN2754_c0_g1_i2:89-760(-)
MADERKLTIEELRQRKKRRAIMRDPESRLKVITGDMVQVEKGPIDITPGTCESSPSKTPSICPPDTSSNSASLSVSAPDTPLPPQHESRESHSTSAPIPSVPLSPHPAIQYPNVRFCHLVWVLIFGLIMSLWSDHLVGFHPLAIWSLVHFLIQTILVREDKHFSNQPTTQSESNSNLEDGIIAGLDWLLVITKKLKYLQVLLKDLCLMLFIWVVMASFYPYLF